MKAKVTSAVAFVILLIFVSNGISIQPLSVQAQGSWAIRASMNSARETPGVVGFRGKVYVFGGTNSTGPLSSAEVYDPQNNTWTYLKPMPTPKGIASAVVIGNKIYVLGSDTKVYIYDPFQDSWAKASDIPQAPNAEHGVGVIRNKLYVAMGNQWLYEYDPLLDRWTSKTPVPVPRSISSIAVLNDKLYAIGGGEPGHQPSEITRVDVYDPVTDSWQIGAIRDMPTRRTHLGRTTPVINGKIYVIGGWDGYRELSSVEVYDPQTNTWSTETPMPTARYHLGYGVVGNKIFAIGGNWGGFGGHWLNVNEEFVVPMPSGVGDLQSVDLNTDPERPNAFEPFSTTINLTNVSDNRYDPIDGHYIVWVTLEEKSSPFPELPQFMQYKLDSQRDSEFLPQLLHPAEPGETQALIIKDLAFPTAGTATLSINVMPYHNDIDLTNNYFQTLVNFQGDPASSVVACGGTALKLIGQQMPVAGPILNLVSSIPLCRGNMTCVMSRIIYFVSEMIYEGILSPIELEANLWSFTVKAVECSDWIGQLAESLIVSLNAKGIPVNVSYVESPVYILVTNAQGQRAGFLDDGTIVSEITDAQVLEQDGKKIVVYPGYDTSSIRVKGVSMGIFSLELFLAKEEGTIFVKYSDVPVDSSTVGIVKAQDVNYAMQIDTNGDGVIDEERLPDEVCFLKPYAIYLPLVVKGYAP